MSKLRSYKKYNLNIENALQKKLSAANRNKMQYEMKSGNNLVIQFTPAVFELVKNNVEALKCLSGWKMEDETHEKSGYEVDKIIKLFKDKKHKCTLSLYNTSSRLLLNGSGIVELAELVLPKLGELIELNINEINNVDREIAKRVKDELKYSSVLKNNKGKKQNVLKSIEDFNKKGNKELDVLQLNSRMETDIGASIEDYNIDVDINTFVDDLINRVCFGMTAKSCPDGVDPVETLGKRRIKKPSKYLDNQIVQNQDINRKTKAQKYVKPIVNSNMKAKTLKNEDYNHINKIHIDGIDRDIELQLNQMRVLMSEKDKELKNIKTELNSALKKIKEDSSKEKMFKDQEEKFAKVLKLKEQMSAAVNSLKQENQVLKEQHKTLNLTINSQKETMESYNLIRNNMEKKINDKDMLIKELELKVTTHQDIAVSFMDELNKEDECEGVNTDQKTLFQKEKCNIYQQLEEKERSIKEINEKLQSAICNEELLRSQIDKMKENEVNKDKIISEEENKKNELLKKEKQNQIKETSKFKESLKTLECINSELNEKILLLNNELKTYKIQNQVKEVINCKQILTNGNDTNSDLKNLKLIIQEKEKEIIQLKNYCMFVEQSTNGYKEKLEKIEQNNKVMCNNYNQAIEDNKNLTTVVNMYREQLKQLMCLKNMIPVENLHKENNSTCHKKMEN